MRIRHLGIVTADLERSATFYEKVFGFKRLGNVRTPVTTQAQRST